jgi:hypothetical protein
MNTEQIMTLADGYATEKWADAMHERQIKGDSQQARRKLKATITTLVQERDALKQDAARYQFVKSLSRASSANIDGNHSWTCNLWIGAIRGPNLDAALDAAMKGKL